MSVSIKRREVTVSDSGLAGLPKLLARVYAARDVNDVEQLQYTLDKLLPYQSLSNIVPAVERIAKAVIEQQHILMVGDYDADGATSTAVAIRGFKMCGNNNVSYLVPNRFEYGYGLTSELVAAAQAQGIKADLVITVDNGISNHDGVDAMKQAGADVIITDHHLPGETLPNAYAIVNPNLDDDPFESKALAGVGVMFYVMIALRQHLQEQGWFEQNNLPRPNLASLLDLVALGTVADVVPLDRNNRILVEQGLRRIRSGTAAVGLLELLRVAKKDVERVTALDLGFAAGPRLNAAGRLEDMAIGIECLLTDDQSKARSIASELNALNIERREIESTMQEQAEEILKQQQDIKAEDKLSICLYDAAWHQGVVGIVASRLKEKVNRPVFVFADENDDYIKGSARSIPGIHIRDVLQRVDASHPDLIVKYGGHAMAAGLSLLPENLDIFEGALEQAVNEMTTPDVFQAVVHSDGELSADELSLDTAASLRAGGPWGQKFPEPLFDGEFKVVSARLLKGKYFKLVVTPLAKPEQYLDAIAFRCDPEKLPQQGQTIHIVYKLDVNHYQGRDSLQLMIEQIFD